MKKIKKSRKYTSYLTHFFMKKYIIPFLFISLFTASAYAEEVLTEQQQIDKKIQEQVDSWVGTIKIFLSEHWECKDILSNKVINTWYTAFITDMSQPMEVRKTAFEAQRTPLQSEIDGLKSQIDTENQLLTEKKQAFIDEYVTSIDNDAKLKEIDTLKNQVLTLTSQMNEKSKQLKNITDDFNSHIYISKEELTKIYEAKVLDYCNQWYGKVELTDKRTLDQQTSNLTLSVNRVASVPAKYKKLFDKVDVLYVKNPKLIQDLYTRLDVVIRKLSKTDKNYDLLFELRKHLQTLLKITIIPQ